MWTPSYNGDHPWGQYHPPIDPDSPGYLAEMAKNWAENRPQFPRFQHHAYPHTAPGPHMGLPPPNCVQPHHNMYYSNVMFDFPRSVAPQSMPGNRYPMDVPGAPVFHRPPPSAAPWGLAAPPPPPPPEEYQAPPRALFPSAVNTDDTETKLTPPEPSRPLNDQYHMPGPMNDFKRPNYIVPDHLLPAFEQAVSSSDTWEDLKASNSASYTAPQDPDKPKTLPAWLRDELEKIERKRKAELVDKKEGAEAGEKKSTGGQLLGCAAALADADESESEDDLNQPKLKPWQRSLQSNSVFASKVAGDGRLQSTVDVDRRRQLQSLEGLAAGDSPGEPAIRTREQFAERWDRLPETDQQTEASRFFSRTLTNALLEVTSEMMLAVATECLRKAKMQGTSLDRVSTASSPKALVAYESDDDEEEDDQKKESEKPASAVSAQESSKPSVEASSSKSPEAQRCSSEQRGRRADPAKRHSSKSRKHSPRSSDHRKPKAYERASRSGTRERSRHRSRERPRKKHSRRSRSRSRRRHSSSRRYRRD